MGKFKPGHKLATGRPVGSKNKKTNLFAMCEEMGIDVFKEMLQGAAAEIDPDKRFNKFKEIAPYLYAKKKETEHKFTPEQLLDMAEEQLVESTGEAT